MASLVALYGYVMAHLGMIFGILLGLEQILAQIPSIESNSYYQLIKKGIAYLMSKVAPAPKV